MIGHRRAAVALYGLSEVDRRWILDELPVTDRDSLVQYLDELKDLGFDRSNLQGVSGDGFALVTDRDITATDRLRAATAAQMFDILRDEPTSLIAQFLSIHHWPWANDFQQFFISARQEHIRSALASVNADATERCNFLLESVASRLNEVADMTAVGLDEKVGQVLSRIKSLVKSWTR